MNDTIWATCLETYHKVCCPIDRYPVNDIFDYVDDPAIVMR